MPLSRLKVWSAGDTPTPSEINAEFDNIIAKFSSGVTAGDLSDSILEADATSINASAYDTLREALNAASLANKDLIIPPGTYDADTTPIEIPANVHVIGAGASLVTIKPATGYDGDTFIRIVGGNSGLEGVTVDASNLGGSNYLIAMVTINTNDAENTYIKHCNFTATGVASAVRCKMIEIFGGDSNREFTQIHNCYFDGSGADSGSTVYGIYLNSSYRTVIDACLFEDLTGNAIYGEALRQTEVKYNRFRRNTSWSYPTTTELRGGFTFEHNNCLANHDHSVTGQGTWLVARSGVSYNAVVRNNLFIHSGITTEQPYYAVYAVGNVVITDNRGECGATGYDYAFIYYEAAHIYRSRAYAQRNTVSGGTLYKADGTSFMNRYHGKSWDDPDRLTIGDVHVWLYHTGTTNYMYFKQGIPNNATDKDVYLTLSGATTSIAD